MSTVRKNLVNQRTSTAYMDYLVVSANLLGRFGQLQKKNLFLHGLSLNYYHWHTSNQFRGGNCCENQA